MTILTENTPESGGVLRGDSDRPRRDELSPVVVVLDRLRSAYNVGNVFRVAEALRVERIVTTGYTATPPHEKLAKTARDCDRLVACHHRETAGEAIAELKKSGHTVYGVETVAGAESVWTVHLKFPAAFVLGNEALGLGNDALEGCDAFIRLPMFGMKNSINVGNAAAVILYEAVRQIDSGPRPGKQV
ncbi:MAG: TrmH family RNA methyltransferase [Lentisphaeria bacterium]|nr:TrmH family RNA methyltransferase [Lentisphaeria bacterium]